MGILKEKWENFKKKVEKHKVETQKKIIQKKLEKELEKSGMSLEDIQDSFMDMDE